MRPHHVLSGALAVAARPSTTDGVAVPAVWNGFGYLFNATVGGQELTVMSDWTWASLFVRSGRCLGSWDPALCVGASRQAWFDERRSATFANASLPRRSWAGTAFVPDFDFAVDYGADTVCVGGACAPGTVLQLSDFPRAAAAVPPVPFAGIFGMAPVTPGLGRDMHPAPYQAWRAGRAGPRVGWNSCAALPSSAPCLGGDAKLVLGGADAALFDARAMHHFAVGSPPWLADAFLPLTPPRTNYWSTAVTGLWARGPVPAPASPNFARPAAPPRAPAAHTTLGLLDDGSEGLGAPLSLRAYRWLVARISAVPAPPAVARAIAAQGSSGFDTAHQQWFTVPCGAAAGFPDLVYELDGRANWTIPPEDYVFKLRGFVPGPVCYLGVNVWKHSRVADGDARLLLGGAFLRRLYVLLDFERLSFCLAPLRRSTS